MESKCITCGHVIDAHTAAFEDESLKPEPGDLSVCLYCSAICRFDDNLNLVKLLTNELEAIGKESPEVYGQLIVAQKVVHKQG